MAKGAGVLRPYINAVRGADRQAQDGGVIAVLDGEPIATARLRAMLGVDADQPLRDSTGLLVHVAVDGHDPTLAATVLAGAKRDGRHVLAIVVGTADVSPAIERALLETRPLEPSNIAHVATLDDPAPIHAAVVRCLDDEAVAAGRRHPAMRPAVAEMLIARASRQAGTIGVVAVIPGADMPAMTLIQVRLVAQLGALYGRPLDARRGIEVAGVLASAFGWRAIARRARGFVPIAGFALRGGVAYSATRAVGEAARTYFAQAGDNVGQPTDGLQATLKRALSRRGHK
jgi:uncharacterized protein (DUF697 family)